MAGSLFGGIQFDRLADDDDDDDFYGSRGSEFETESLSSSSTDEGDEQMWAAPAPQRQLRKRRHVSTSEDSSTDMEEMPTWFHHGPFRYNGRMAVLALPGFVLALLFSGELLVISSNIIITKRITKARLITITAAFICFRME